MLVTEEPLKASGSAQLSSCLVYQDLGCPLALQTKAYVYGPFITSLQYSLRYFSFVICIDRWSYYAFINTYTQLVILIKLQENLTILI